MGVSALELFGFLSVASSQLFNLSCLPSILEIRRSRSTLAYTAEPFIAALLSCWINFCYAFVAGRFGVLVSVGLSAGFNSFYFLTHLRFTKTPSTLIRTFGFRLIFATIFLFSIPLISLIFCSSASAQKTTHFWFGVNSMLLGSYVNLAQLVPLPSILRQRSSASISPPLTIATLFSCMCWTIYGALLCDAFYVITNVIGVLSALVQFFLLIVFPRRSIDQALLVTVTRPPPHRPTDSVLGCSSGSDTPPCS